MPTGYTAPIHDNQPITFAEFTWRCARAFGALIHMRDENMGAPTLEQALAGFSDSWSVKHLAECRAKLERLEAMTPEQMESEYTTYLQRREAEHAEHVARNADLRRRYQAMLNQVMRWDPPTDGHVGLRNFMIQQLEESIRFDAYEPEPLSLPSNMDTYRNDVITAARRSVASAEDSLNKDQACSRERRAWIMALHASIPCPKANQST